MSEELFDDIKEKIKAKIEAAERTGGTDEIVCIVDRSGSMWSIKDDAAGGLNSFINQQAEFGDANLTIVEFDNTIDTVCDRVDIHEAEEYNLNPGGSTALLDAIGLVVSNSLKYNAPDGKTIVVVVTDGGENASKEWTRDGVFEMIEERKKDGWEFLFLASNQDAISVGSSYGFGADNSISFANNARGFTAGMDTTAMYVGTLRGGGSYDDAQMVKKAYVDANLDVLSDTGAVDDTDDTVA